MLGSEKCKHNLMGFGKQFKRRKWWKNRYEGIEQRESDTSKTKGKSIVWKVGTCNLRESSNCLHVSVGNSRLGWNLKC